MSLTKYLQGRLVVLPPRATVYDASRAMADNHIGAVIVHDGEHVVGMVTDRDLGLAVAEDEDPFQAQLDEVMSSPAVVLPESVAEVDARRITGYQDFVDDAPLDLIYVAGGSPARHLPGWEDDVFDATCAGAIAQNVYLFCAEQGLNTVVRAWCDRMTLAKTLALGRDERVLLTQTVGYPPAARGGGPKPSSK